MLILLNCDNQILLRTKSTKDFDIGKISYR
jgi:hypothetical protein